METEKIIERFYTLGSVSHDILLRHSRLVAAKAVAIAEKVPHLKPDIRFIAEAAMLHDIGIFKTHAPGIGCTGDKPYIHHGYLGGELLESLGLNRHALVCERHTGSGLTAADIRRGGLGLPERDMVPESIEEIIICYADKFFSKNPDSIGEEAPLPKVLNLLEKFGEDQVARFSSWVQMFDL